MRLSILFAPTRKEDPADAEVASHKLLLRAGYIRMTARGVYSFLPLGWRCVRKVERIVREEMERVDAQEVRLPSLQPAELWQESGRWEAYGADLMRLKDRKSSDFALGPTHEEVVTDIARHDLVSYKQLPVTLFQMQTKFRDEPRPRFGLMRGREFIMKDAYSFDLDVEGAERSYAKMKGAYDRIFERFGFEFRAVEADSGNIGGSLSHEFQVLAETGEDLIASCPTSGYAANVEKAEIAIETARRDETIEQLTMRPVATPGAKTIAQVAEQLQREERAIVKTLIYLADGDPYAVCMRGDHQVNEVKLKLHLEASRGGPVGQLELADEAATGRLTRAPVGFAGPVGLPFPVVLDRSVEPMVNFVTGANRKDEHLEGVNWGRDFEVEAFVDLRRAQPGDRCARSGELYEFVRGIEVGHIFYLGTKYTEALRAELQGEDGKLRPIEMGCYGIGITRIVAAAVEQNHDERGIIWPMAIAPYHVILLPLQMKNEEVVQAAEALYETLQRSGCEVLLDDRDLRAGAKFKDAELIGVPLQVNFGARGLKENKVEFKRRAGGEVELIELSAIADHVRHAIDEALAPALPPGAEKE